jgi:hypothetical protein
VVLERARDRTVEGGGTDAGHVRWTLDRFVDEINGLITAGAAAADAVTGLPEEGTGMGTGMGMGEGEREGEGEPPKKRAGSDGANSSNAGGGKGEGACGAAAPAAAAAAAPAAVAAAASRWPAHHRHRHRHRHRHLLLTRNEVIACRLYTGPGYEQINNGFLRKVGGMESRAWRQRLSQIPRFTYSRTVAHLVSATTATAAAAEVVTAAATGTGTGTGTGAASTMATAAATDADAATAADADADADAAVGAQQGLLGNGNNALTLSHGNSDGTKVRAAVGAAVERAGEGKEEEGEILLYRSIGSEKGSVLEESFYSPDDQVPVQVP